MDYKLGINLSISGNQTQRQQDMFKIRSYKHF
jgi:hypothetical protein